MTKKGFSTVEEVLDDILKILTPEYQAKVREMSVHDFCVKQHFNLGLLIRNKYFYQNPVQERLIKNLGGTETDYMLLDGDHISAIILKKLYEKIKKMEE